LNTPTNPHFISNDRADPRRSRRIDTSDDAIDTGRICCIPRLLPILRGVDMDAFLSAAIASVAVTLLLLVTNPRTVGDKLILRIRGVTSAVVTRRAFNLAWVTLSILLFTLLLMFVLAPLRPRGGAVYGLGEFVGAQRFASLILGILFGTLFVLWIRQLLAIEDPKQITWVRSHFPRAAARLGRVLGRAGVVGGTTDPILRGRSVFQPGPAKISRGRRNPPAHRGRGSGFERPANTCIIPVFSGEHPGFHHRRRELHPPDLARAPPAAGASVPATETDFIEHVASYAKCLDAISTETGDDDEVTRRLVPLKPALHEISRRAMKKCRPAAGRTPRNWSSTPRWTFSTRSG
jgi:hypothetical protein